METGPTAARISGLEGQRLGPYEVAEMIGRGGMAVVYKALQPSLHRFVAVKVLPPYFVHEEGFLDRFQREANTVARLQHPNILSVYDFSQEGDLPYIVMPLITGGTLRAWLRQQVPLARALPVFNLVLSALEYAHDQGVVHRDIKPNNILMHHGDWPLLTDFGIARIVEQSSIGDPSLRVTQSSTISGTPQYMAPEQVEGGPLDRRADLYAMGIILFEMLTGRLLFEATSPMAVMLQHAQADIPSPRRFNPTLSPVWDEVIRRSLARDPGGRYASARIMAEAVQAAWSRAQQEGAAVRQASRAHAQLVDRYAPGDTTGQARAQTLPIVETRRPLRPPPPETTLRLSDLRPPPPEHHSAEAVVGTPRRSRGTKLALTAGLVVLALATMAGVWLVTGREHASAQSATDTSTSADLLAVCSWRAHDWIEAVAACERLQQSNPQYPGLREATVIAYLSRGKDQAQAGTLADAIASFDAALAINPDLEEAKQQRLLALTYQEGAAAAEAGNWPLASEKFEQVFATVPNYFNGLGERAVKQRLHLARVRWGQALLAEGNYPEAQKRCEQALTLLADGAEALACKATALAAMATPTPRPTATALPVAVVATPTQAAPSAARRPPDTRPPATPTARPAAIEPRPELTGRPPSNVRIGQPFEVEFQATNRGAAAQRGSITISVTGAADVRILSSTVKDGHGSYAKLFQPGESMYQFKEGTSRPVQNPLVEAYTNERSEAGQTHRLRVEIVPHGVVSIQARATLREDTRFFHAPTDGPTDQQGAPARSFRIVPSS